MNVHDSERMAGLLEQAGYEPTSDDREADVVVINTCSVREHAEEKLYTRLGELRVLEEETGRAPIVAVAGCVAQQEGDALLKKTNGHLIDVVLGTQRLKMLPALVERGGRGATAAAKSTSARCDDVTFPLGDHAARRRRPGLRDDHRRLQRPLRVLRRAVHARARAHARARPTSCSTCGRRWRRAASEIQLLGQIVNHYQAPGRSCRATSRSCWRRSTTCRASSASASRARIRATPAPA